MRIIALLMLVATTVSAATLLPGGFCDRYATALFGNSSAPNQWKLLDAVLKRTILGCNAVNASLSNGGACTGLGSTNTTIVIGLLDSASLNRGFFDGTGTFAINPPTGSQAVNTAAGISVGTGGSTRFANMTGDKLDALNPAATFLITHLTQFFAAPLGCADNAASTAEEVGISSYEGLPNMTALHKNMVITNAVWTGFITAFVDTTLSFGVNETDVTGILAPLVQNFLRAPTGDNVICNQQDCLCATGFTGTPGTACVAVQASSSSSLSSSGSAASSSSSSVAPAPTTNNTASIVSASPIMIGAAAVALTMLF